MGTDSTSRFSDSIYERFNNLSVFAGVNTGLIDSLKRMCFNSDSLVQVSAHDILKNLIVGERLALAIHSCQIEPWGAVIFIINYR